MRVVPIIVGLALLAGCGATAPSSLTRRQIADLAQQVEIVLDDWHNAAAHGDSERYFGHFTADGIFMGTDATERWNVNEFRESAQEPFADGEGWVIHPAERRVRIASRGDIAWFDEDLETPHMGACRGTGVLVRENNVWKIAHYNLTITVPNDRFGEVRQLLSQPAPSNATEE